MANISGIAVTEYLKGSTKPHATITKGPTYPIGIAIDHAGNLYASNYRPYSDQNIQVYAPGSKSPSRTIADGVSSPVGIAVDAHDTLYVTTQDPPSRIEEYRSGQSKPFRTITDKLSYPDGPPGCRADRYDILRVPRRCSGLSGKPRDDAGEILARERGVLVDPPGETPARTRASSLLSSLP